MADAPKLLPTDTLKISYPKINQAIDNANEAKQMTLDNKGLITNSGSIYPLDNIVREGVLNPVDQRVKDTILYTKVYGARPGKVYAIEWLGNGYVNNEEARYSMTIVEFDKANFGINSATGRRVLKDFKNYNFPVPTENIVNRIINIPEEELMFVVTYDHSKVNAEFLNITDKTYGSAKGCVIHENNYTYFEKQGYLSNNSGVLYPFKNTKRDNTMYAESKEINAAILDVKIQNAKKGKKYKIDFIGNGTTAWGEPNYSIYLQEMDEHFQNIVQIFSRSDHNFLAPTEPIVTRIVSNPKTDIIMSITIDYSKMTKNSYPMNASNNEGYGYIVDESKCEYTSPIVTSGGDVSGFPLICSKTGKNHRVQFPFSDTKNMIIDFDELGINKIFHPRRIYSLDKVNGGLNPSFAGATLIKSINTDWISPYGLAAINNPLNLNSFTVGGNHGTNSSSGFATARNISVSMYADNQLISDGQAIYAKEKVVIDVLNYIAAPNVIDLTTGEKRDSVAEYVTYTITPKNINVSVTLEALEEVDLKYYLGIQAEKDGPWYKYLYYMPDVNQTIIDMTVDTSEGNSGLYPESKVDRFVMKKGNFILVGQRSNEIGVGRSTMIIGQKIFKHTAGIGGKVYGHLIGKPQRLKVGDTLYFTGSYTFTESLSCPGAETAYFIKEGQEKIYCVDFFEAVSNTFLQVDKDDFNKKISIVEKSESVTVDSFTSSRGLKMSATGYGQLKFKVD
ncbi:hypothetical protein [Bacillus sp. ABP14]|uniref:hypothetical protein n=1 Tax=Bacillus sp. ABP14 TaxID=1892404 RepID=UPI0011A64B83|nr:hypothetical protein [Bacillus sp. ABP14]